MNIETYDNFTLKFQQKRTWHFVPELSNGTMSDDVTTLNVPAVVGGLINDDQFQSIPIDVFQNFREPVTLCDMHLFGLKSVLIA